MCALPAPCVPHCTRAAQHWGTLPVGVPSTKAQSACVGHLQVCRHAPRLQVVMVNSTWTSEHIASLWWTLLRPQIVYPPCNVAALAALPLDRKLKCLYMVSLAQVSL